MKLSHIDKNGEAIMVDVSAKDITVREAVATGKVYMKPETLALIIEGNMPKGDVIAVARVAGIMAAKKTHELIPMCHSIPLDSVRLEFSSNTNNNSIEIKAVARCSWKTGVEMEALTAVSVAALTVYDMCKAVDKDMLIGDIMLVKKTGGKSGEWTRKGG
jgi:cyclic pyranopterin monophosphate synthase